MLGSLIVALVAALLISVRHAALKTRQTAAGERGRPAAPLPEDVESVVRSFGFSQVDQGGKVRISGTTVVRRGRRILGLRSNLAKTNFIENLKGSVESGGRSTGFTASSAEWDADAAHPLLLNKDVTVTLDGRPPFRVANARVYLSRGILEIDNGSRNFPLK